MGLRNPSLAPWILAAALCPGRAQDRLEIINRSPRPWTLALVEGTRPGRGSFSLLDKFTGKPLGDLDQVGKAATLPPQGRILLVFHRDGGYLYRNFILKDIQGLYAEYVASVEFISNPIISINLIDQHVGPPLDQAEDGAIKQFISDGIEINAETLIIHPPTLEFSPKTARTSPSGPAPPPQGKFSAH